MGVDAHTLEVAGTARRVLVATPDGRPSNLVLSLHGSRSSPEGQLRLSRMEALTAEGALIAFPEGGLTRGSGYEWDLERDGAFLDALISWLLRRHQPANQRVVLTGMSGGARMSSSYAAWNPDRVLLLGAVAGLRAPPPGHRVDRARPVPVVAFHGTSDRINPYEGSRTPRWDESVLDAARAWAGANGLGGEPRVEQPSRGLACYRFGPDGDPGVVTLWECARAGHTWPGARLPLGLRLLLGRTSRHIDATAEIWRVAATSSSGGE